MEKWFNEQVAPDWMAGRQKMMSLLQDEAELEEIVRWLVWMLYQQVTV